MTAAVATDTAAPPCPVFTGPSAAPPRSVWEVFTRAWRPCGCWVLVVILAVRGAALPLLQWHSGQPVEALDWTGMVALAGLLGFGALRSFDRKEGTA